TRGGGSQSLHTPALRMERHRTLRCLFAIWIRASYLKADIKRENRQMKRTWVPTGFALVMLVGATFVPVRAMAFDMRAGTPLVGTLGSRRTTAELALTPRGHASRI